MFVLLGPSNLPDDAEGSVARGLAPDLPRVSGKDVAATLYRGQAPSLQGLRNGAYAFLCSLAIKMISWRTMHFLKKCDKKSPPSIDDGDVLRAGCDSPPAVMMRKASSPRALGGLRVVKVSRPGVIPGPTVIVRMKRERDWQQGRPRAHFALTDLPQNPIRSMPCFFIKQEST